MDENLEENEVELEIEDEKDEDIIEDESSEDVRMRITRMRKNHYPFLKKTIYMS